jgi:hypothetical protein
MIFAIDFNGTTVSNTVAGDFGEKRPFIQSGYTSDETLPRMTHAGEFAAIAEYLPARLIRRAISVAIAAAQGREVKEKVVIPIEVVKSPPNAGAPHLQARYKSMLKEKSSE